jgi:diphthamide biosynthesis protein 7
LFKIWDLRTSTAVVNKHHEAGVCTVSKHPRKEHILATGSYDENIRIWDTRSLKVPIAIASTGGGVWRLKWHPEAELLLAAAMYNGFHVYSLQSEDNFKLESQLEYQVHKSIAYGADWSHKNMGMIGTCSFYDHLLTTWYIS